MAMTAALRALGDLLERRRESQIPGADGAWAVVYEEPAIRGAGAARLEHASVLSVTRFACSRRGRGTVRTSNDGRRVGSRGRGSAPLVGASPRVDPERRDAPRPKRAWERRLSVGFLFEVSVAQAAR